MILQTPNDIYILELKEGDKVIRHIIPSTAIETIQLPEPEPPQYLNLADRLINYLPSAFTRSKNSNVYKLIEIIATIFQDIFNTLEDVRKAHSVDDAFGRSLDYIGSLFNCHRSYCESDSHYRARIKLQSKKVLSIASIKDIKETTAAVLNVDQKRITLIETWQYEPASFQMWFWLNDIEQAGITLEEFETLLQDIKPAGVKLTAIARGTFEYRSVGDTSDPAKGYNDLANSNPDGGTYASIMFST